MRWRWDDRGSTSVELAVLVPGILLVGLLVIAAARIHAAQQTVDHAAAVAARDASLARTPNAATSAANTAATRVFQHRDMACASTQVAVNTGGFATQPGQLGLARVRVSCTVALSDLALPGLPGSKTLTSTFASPVDPYRATPAGFTQAGGGR